MNTYHAIGLMSGSSLDGLDIAYCRFTNQNGEWQFDILQCGTVAFADEWVQDLKHLPIASARTIAEAHAGLGRYFGQMVSSFIKDNALAGKVDLVASHGHTIFHFPDKKFTTQIGDGAAIAAACGVPVVCDFRTADIAFGGQGTPIVPIGDKLLFGDYKFCLNIGGISNISCKTPKGIIAFDICPANQVLNLFASKLGAPYDNEGQFAADGTINEELLSSLNDLEYYSRKYPKSLDNSFTREAILPCFEDFDITVEDMLRTYCEHIAIQIGEHIRTIAEKENLSVLSTDKMLITGGGAFNTFLIKLIQQHAGIEVVVPETKLVQFKEALVIAFMGVLRLRNEVNVLASVTGASKDSVGGCIYTTPTP